ncbi:MAG: hypothetical protein RL077_1297 [Verrucomicrobiota bacterium]|jgi:hypothetical protein
MNRRELFHRLEFHDDATFHEQVGMKPFPSYSNRMIFCCPRWNSRFSKGRADDR